jgi:hypothetical protein
MIPIRELLYAVRNTFDQWLSLRSADVHFDQTWVAVLVLVVLMAVAGMMLLARGLRREKAGRTHVALPAVLPVMRSTHFALLRHTAFLVFLIGVPFFAVALADPHTAFTREDTSYPGRRIALLVDGSSSMVMKFETKSLKTPENRAVYTAVAGRALHEAAMNGRTRPHRAHPVRERSLRRHAVHDGLRKHHAEHPAHQQSEGMGQLQRLGHDDHAGPESGDAAVPRLRLRQRRRERNAHVHRRQRRRERAEGQVDPGRDRRHEEVQDSRLHGADRL